MRQRSFRSREYWCGPRDSLAMITCANTADLVLACSRQTNNPQHASSVPIDGPCLIHHQHHCHCGHNLTWCCESGCHHHNRSSSPRSLSSSTEWRPTRAACTRWMCPWSGRPPAQPELYATGSCPCSATSQHWRLSVYGRCVAGSSGRWSDVASGVLLGMESGAYIR